MNTSTASTLSPPAGTPRIRRGDAAALAQYIQDLTHPTGAEVRTVAA